MLAENGFIFVSERLFGVRDLVVSFVKL